MGSLGAAPHVGQLRGSPQVMGCPAGHPLRTTLFFIFPLPVSLLHPLTCAFWEHLCYILFVPNPCLRLSDWRPQPKAQGRGADEHGGRSQATLLSPPCMECFWNLRGIPIPRPLHAGAKPGFESEWTSQLKGGNTGVSPDTGVIPAALSSLLPPLTLHPPLPNRRQPRSQPRVSDLCPQAAAGAAAENPGLSLPDQPRCADPSCCLCGWSPGATWGCRPALPCPCPLSPSLGTATWPPDLGLSLPLATGCPALLMNFPGGSGPFLCPDL